MNFKANRVKLSGLIHEHFVPKREIWKELRKPGTRTIDEVRRILTDWCIGVVVTKEEDTRLNKAGLRSKMPDDWDNKDPWARYKTAGIAVDPEPNGTC